MIRTFARRAPGRDTRRARRGAAAMEFAMTMPVMAFLLVGVVEYSWFMTRRAMVEQASVEVARFAAVQTADTVVGTALATGPILLEGMGFDCDDVGCSVVAQTVNVAGVTAVQVDLTVDYAQLTGAFPAGNGWMSLALPDTLRGRATVPVTPPL